VGPGEWRYKGDLVRDQICHFPHAVLEVKLQLAGSQQTPDWVQDLLDTGMLVEVNKFGKFVHGLAALLPPTQVRELPYWFHQVDLDGDGDAGRGGYGKEANGIELDGKQPGNGGESHALLDGKDGRARRVPHFVYKPKEPSCLERLGRFFLTMSNPDPFQKTVSGKLVVEPKVYFANERTFLTWGSLCVQLGSIAIAILSISHHRPSILRVGVLLGGLTTIFFLYALAVFHARAAGLRVRSTEAPYDDRFGPTMVAAIMLVAIGLNAYVSLSNTAGGALVMAGGAQ